MVKSRYAHSPSHSMLLYICIHIFFISRLTAYISSFQICLQVLRFSHRMIMNKYEQYEPVFDHFDENKDGKISPSELQQCVGAVGGELSLAEAEAAVKYSDSDGDGLLSLEEFVRFVEGGEEEEKVNDLKEAFKMYEMEESGCITPKSLKRMLSRLGLSSTIEECQTMISKFDLNGDGVLSFDEFKIMVL